MSMSRSTLITGPDKGKLMKSLFLAAVLIIASSFPATAESVDIKITELVITSKLVKGKPIDSIKRLSSSTDKNLYCFTRTTAPAGTDGSIKHLWYRGEEKVGEFTLPVKGDKWRTYSKKSIQKGWAGDWRVDVVDDGGKLLKTVKFRMN
jgi:hypothetical protein